MGLYLSFLQSYNNQLFFQNMNQITTQQYAQLLLRFYEIISQNHSRKIENQTKIRNMLGNNQTLVKIRDQQYVKKISRATDCSLTSGCQSKIPLIMEQKKVGDLHFTFCPKINDNQKQFKGHIINLRYQSHSIFKVLLFSICFNHLHLLTQTQTKSLKIAHVFNISQKIIESLSFAIQEAKKSEIKKGRTYQNTILQSLYSFIHDLGFKQDQNIVLSVKNLINKLSNQMVRQLCLGMSNPKDKMVNTHLIGRTDLRVLRKNNSSACINANEEDDIDILDSLASALKIRLKLKNEKESISWGNKNAKICFVISQSTKEFQFYLKQIIYYKQKLTEKRQTENNLKKSYKIDQFIEI